VYVKRWGHGVVKAYFAYRGLLKVYTPNFGSSGATMYFPLARVKKVG
jgi:hypothetical protein